MDRFLAGMIVVLSGVVGLMIYAGIHDWHNNQRLMAQCQADGHKEYECVSMLRDNRPTTVVMPVYTGR